MQVEQELKESARIRDREQLESVCVREWKSQTGFEGLKRRERQTRESECVSVFPLCNVNVVF